MALNLQPAVWKLKAWRESVGAQMPLPNPDYDPARASRQPSPKGERSKGK